MSFGALSVAAGGDSTLANCEMLCIFHNRSKGNL